MSLRWVHALQAALLSVIVTIPLSYLILTLGNDASMVKSGTVAACGSVLVTTLSIWYLVFPNPNTPPRRGIWVGPLIVFLSIWIMFTGLGLSFDSTYHDSGGIIAILLKAVLVSFFFALFGSLYAGLLLFPLAIVIIIYFRKWQIRKFI